MKEVASSTPENGNQLVVLDRLIDVRIEPSERTKGRIERGEISGAKILYRKKAAEVLQSGVTEGKDDFFLGLAYTGLDIRKAGGRNDTEYSKAYRYDRFTEAIAEELEISPDTLQKLLRAVRADIVYEEFDLDRQVLSVFKGTVEEYLSDFLDEKHKDKSKGAQRVQTGWDQTVKGFYKSLFDKPQAKNAAWVPYEVEFLAAYFEDRIQNDSPLTRFDKLILEEGVRNVDKSDTLKRVSKYTQMPIGSSNVITAYRHLLIFGSPIKVEK